MRVQFCVSNVEWQQLLQKSQTAGYPDVPSYCKDLALGCRTYGTLWQTVVYKISQMKKRETFALRDLIDTPPSNLGVKLHDHQNELNIEVLPQKDNLNANRFIKL